MTEPEVGHWYRRLNGNLFEVVAVDDEDGTVELQHFDGTIEEMEFDVWQDTDLEPVEAPEDWSGSVDVDATDMPEPELVASLGWQDPLVIIDNSE